MAPSQEAPADREAGSSPKAFSASMARLLASSTFLHSPTRNRRQPAQNPARFSCRSSISAATVS